MQRFARHTATRLAMVLAATLTMVLGAAAPAFASDVDLEGVTTTCVEGEPSGLAYTAVLFQRTDETQSATVEVAYRLDGAGDYTVVDELVLDAGNGFRASGSADGLDLSGDRVTVRLRVTESDNPKVQGDSASRTVDVGACDSGSDNGATATFTICRDGAAAPAALLGNLGDEPLTYTVTGTVDGKQSVQTVEVAPRDANDLQRVPVTIPGIDDLQGREMRLVVEVDGGTELDRTFTIDCDVAGDELELPTAEARVVCTTTGALVAVDLTNPNAEAVTVDVTVAGTTDQVEVGPDSSTTVEYAVEDGQVAVLATALERTLLDTELEVDCAPSPSVEVTTACFSQVGSIEIELVNPDSTPTTFTIAIDGEVLRTVEVADGSLPTSFPVNFDAHDVVVTADGATVYDETVLVQCSPQVFADATTTVECSETGGRLVATIDNPGDATTAQLSVDGELVADVDVPSLSLTDLPVPDLADGLYEVVVIVDGATLLSEAVEVDCVEVLGVVEDRGPDGDPDGAPVVAGGAEELPNAGAESIAWVLFALVLVLFGSDLLLSELRSRFRRLRG